MADKELVLSCISKSKILKWHVKCGEIVKRDKVLATYIFTEKVTDANNFIVQRKLKAKLDGKIIELTVLPNEEITRGQVVARMQEELCEHPTVMKDMCCKCGADLRKEPGIPGELAESTSAAMPVVHNIHELRVSLKEAERLARYDEKQLLKNRKLVLVVDLDMTLLHTTVEPVPRDAQDVYSFTLPGHPFKYHTKLRPGARKFLESISKFYELHIFTMGSRMYAHTVAKFLDPDGKFFAHRIRSRDEFINSHSKVHDLKALFPCGDHMVSIIDDREDVWNYAPNLITVKAYRFFKSTGDIHNPFQPESTLDIANKDTSANSDSSLENQNGANTPESEDEAKKSTSNTVNENGDDSKGNKIDTETNLMIDLTENEVEKDDDEKACTDKSKDKAEVNSEILENASNKQKDNPVKKIVGDSNGTDLDDYLNYLDEILERVHFSFYSALDGVKSKGGAAIKDPEITRYCTENTINPDVRVVVPELRRQTLTGANLVFTGVVPNNMPLEKSRPWRIAISLGARVTQDIFVQKRPDQNGLFTTHVIAARHGTQKAHKASRTPGLKLVNPNWLSCCWERWERVEEGLFPVPNIFLSEAKKFNNYTDSPPLEESRSGKEILDTISPLASFSKEELDDMDKEVEDLLSSDGTEDDDEESKRSEFKGISVIANKESDFTKNKGTASKEELGSILKRKNSSPHSSHHSKRKKRRSTSINRLKSIETNESDSNQGCKVICDEDENELLDDSSSSDSDTSTDSDGDSSSCSSGSSSDDSDIEGKDNDSSDSCDDLEIGNMLERRISESADD